MSTEQERNAVFRRYLSAMALHSLASAEAAGLNATDYFVLNLLDLTGPRTSGELARWTGLSTGATTRMIDRLEQRGHVKRGFDPADRRKVVVEMGEPPKTVGQAVAGARRRIGGVIGAYSGAEQEILFRYFAEAAEAYQASTEELIDRRTSMS
ncbi:MarR family winged helix-turn-helix transcriptional regulator [Kribbella solani]|uniref:DNA-binding MarR family transcriptional regulator n=1 Tax=Kribbella solani TaxID=236067 RepID=A0A841E7E4_9ACTN|nr:MarR family transcriptional regulator [Kribbella solani]MBB5983198.1 DNA-binding MarR family transcriptional regulator [Kribbella solani]